MLKDRPSLLTWLASHDPLTVMPLDDPVVEATGHDPRSPYAETYWTPCLGPTAILLLRRLAGWLEHAPGGMPVPLTPLARELGLGEATGRNSPIVRSLARIVEFNMASVRGDALAVRRMLPTLARRHESRLPGHLAAQHRAELEALVRTARGAPAVGTVVVGTVFGGSAGSPPGRGWGRPPAGPALAPGTSDGRSAA